jgi:hypothetical protein
LTIHGSRKYPFSFPPSIEKTNSKKAKLIFNLGKKDITVGKEYCYLGIKMNNNGIISL